MPTILATLLFCVAAPGSGQETEALPRAGALPASTRAMALGDAYQTGSRHADAVFYHPALLGRASGFGLAWQRWSAESSSASASAAVEWLGGGVGVGLRAFQYSDEPLSGFPFPAPPRRGQDDLFDVGSRPVSERIASLGYGRELPWLELDVGAVAELVDQRMGTSQHTVLLFDLGLARTVGPLTVALTAHDLGTKPVVDVGDDPSRWTLGLGGYGRPVGPLDLGMAARLGLDHEERVTWGGGLEIGYWPIQGRTFVARIGVQDAPDDSDVGHLTTGFAFWGDDLTVEWAFRPVSGADEGGTHRFGVRFR
ncbi:MAG: hypothetical protein R3304_03770 [Longimicrobiales bacterium]|nr:hypothetical protein [Longimicrobiales bacterium]